MKCVNSFMCFPSGLDWKTINFVLIQQIGHAQLSVQGNCTGKIRLNLPQPCGLQTANIPYSTNIGHIHWCPRNQIQYRLNPNMRLQCPIPNDFCYLHVPKYKQLVSSPFLVQFTFIFVCDTTIGLCKYVPGMTRCVWCTRWYFKITSAY